MGARKILVVDDSDRFRTSVRNTLGRLYALTETASEAAFRQVYRPYCFDLVILDMRLESGREGLRLLREILALDELQPVIMVSAYGDTDAVIDSAEAGALMFLHKQEFSPELLARMVEAVLQQAQTRRQLAALQDRAPAAHGTFLGGANAAIRRVREQIRRTAESRDSVVLVAGEPGAGHFPLAQSVHELNPSRTSGPFVVASGLSLAEGDAQAALFGAPSAREPHRNGLLEQAMRGVLLLEHAPALPASVSRQVWHTLKTRLFRVGDHEIPLDLQLVLGASPDEAEHLAEELALAGIESIRINLPALRERREDIVLLANIHLQTLRQQGRTPARTFSRSAVRLLEVWHWPGNLAELNNAIEFAGIQAMLDGSEGVEAHHLPTSIQGETPAGGQETETYRVAIARAEIALVERSLQAQGELSNTQLAKMLGYTDRFAIARRLRKALSVSDELAKEFPLAAQHFLSRSRAA